MKIMSANSKIKHKSKAMFVVTRNLVLDFLLCFVTAYMRKYLIHVISAQGARQKTLISLEEVSKNSFMTQFTAITTHKKWSKLLQWKLIVSI